MAFFERFRNIFELKASKTYVTMILRYIIRTRVCTMQIKEKLKNLTITEKLRLLTGFDGFSALRLPEKGLMGVQMADGPYGVKTKEGRGTCFLNTCLMASSWDREACFEIGKMLGSGIFPGGKVLRI